ncbi:TrbC/VirB2 family protein [Aureimonas sp. N4]|uniref:TrbC/VirB2 family protein n=1 Tax=Aureimonas sp. N4 TaxID=1638165 RepID=UPI0009E7D19A|nr:TrbC/VirB2 family protein [Aureimonas sp. N4]
MTIASRKSVALLVMACSIALSATDPARAQEFSGVLQNIVDMLTGDTARLLAVLGVIITGFLWIFGYLDLRRCAIVVAGIVILFSAEEIVGMITGA